MLRVHQRSLTINKLWRKMLAQGEKLFSISDIIASRQEYFSANRYVKSLVVSGHLEMIKHHNGSIISGR